MISALENDQSKADEGEGRSQGRSDTLARLEKLYSIKSSMLCQKARMDWQLQGERNTRFFHIEQYSSHLQGGFSFHFCPRNQKDFFALF